MFQLECNKQNIEYDHRQKSQPAGICRDLPLTDNYEEFTLESDAAPFLKNSVKTIPIGGGDVVVRQKMAKSDRYRVTGSRTIIDNIVG